MISVIIPVYNTAAYLRQCMDSLTGQTYADFEALVVEDGSTDGSDRICDEIAAGDDRIRVFHLENGGVSRARNFALSQARGEYIAFLDSDDWMEKDMLAKLHAAVDGSGADAAMCNAYNAEDDKRYPAPLCRGLPEAVCGDEIFRVFVGRSGTLWNKLIGAKCIGETRFREDMRYGEDIFFLRDIASDVHQLHIMQDPLYNYRRLRQGNVTSAALNDRYADLLKMTEMAASELFALGFDFEAVSRIRMCAGRLLKAASFVPMQASADYRRRLTRLLKLGAPHARILLRDHTVHRNSRYIRYMEYMCCRISPALVVLLYKARNALLGIKG